VLHSIRSMHPGDAEVAHRALGQVFWGAVICSIDIWVSQHSHGYGFRFDFINDVIGTVLIALGIRHLRPLLPEAEYYAIMGFCLTIAILSIGDAVIGHVIAPWPSPLVFVSAVFEIVCLFAIYRFCEAMWRFSVAYCRFDVERSWTRSRNLCFYLLLCPAIALRFVSLVLTGFRPEATVNVGLIAILPVIAALIAVVHILVSISRTRDSLVQYYIGRPR